MLYRGKKTYKNTVKIRGVNCGFFFGQQAQSRQTLWQKASND